MTTKPDTVQYQAQEEQFQLAVSVDIVILGYDDSNLKVLIRECEMAPFTGRPALLGDLVYNNEDLDEAAKRVLKLRTGLSDVYLEQVKAIGDVKRHPHGRVITVAYYSLVKISEYTIPKTPDNLKWVNVEDAKNLAFDHDRILCICLEILRKKIRNKPIGFNLLPEKFTLKELQNLFEAVLNIELDKRNFRRKLKASNYLVDLGEREENVAHRPAKLFTFNSSKIEEFMINDPAQLEF